MSSSIFHSQQTQHPTTHSYTHTPAHTCEHTRAHSLTPYTHLHTYSTHMSTCTYLSFHPGGPQAWGWGLSLSP